MLRSDSLLVHLDFISGRLRAKGRLDGTTAHLLHDAVSAALLTRREPWTVDVTSVTVGDSIGLSALGAATTRLRPPGQTLHRDGSGAAPPDRSFPPPH